MDNKLAAFYASIKKLVTDYMAYVDQSVRKLTENVKKCEELCERIEALTEENEAVKSALSDLVAEGDALINELRGGN